MKLVAIAGAILLLLVTGWLYMREPAPETVALEPDVAVQAAPVAEIAEQEAASDDDAQPQMVEESAAEEEEAEAGDQPIMLAQANTSSISRDWLPKVRWCCLRSRTSAASVPTVSSVRPG